MASIAYLHHILDGFNSHNSNSNNNQNNNNNNNNNNNGNDDHRYYDRPHNRHNNSDAPKTSATVFLTIIVLILLFCVLYHLFYIYVLRSSPYYYSVQSDIDPTVWHVERVVPLRERIRQWQNKPRSDSDIFRDEDLDRVRRALNVRGWKGRVNSDGTPNKNHRIGDERCGFSGGGYPSAWGYDGEVRDEEYGPRQYVESEDTPFWKERQWGQTKDGAAFGKPKWIGNYNGYNTFSTPAGSSPKNMRFNPRGGHVIPGMTSSQWPTGVVTPDFGSYGSNNGRGSHLFPPKGGYGLNAAFEYQASPRNMHFITPPIRASSKILEGLNHTGLRYTVDRTAKFPDEDLQEHYKMLCENEDALLRELEDARDEAAIRGTYGPSETNSEGNGNEDDPKKIIERLTELEKKLLQALKRRTLFADRFATRESLMGGQTDGGEGSSSIVEVPPPPYTDVDENGLNFD